MKKLMAFLLMFMIAYMITSNPFTKDFISNMKGSSFLVAKQEDPLYVEITSVSDQYEIAASDAKIDRVWKKIPGYNGLTVDIQASYEKMKESGKFMEDKLVFQQVEPKIHLNDLPPSPIYKGHPDKPMVSFIVNVAWGNEYLSDMLATLKKHNITLTFFLEGRWVQKNPDLAKAISDAGHELGNHSFTHPDMKIISSSQAREEITKTNEVIKATTGKTPLLFAPPSGSYRDEIVKIAAEEKMETIMWSVDTIDWQKPAPNILINRVIGKIHQGAIVLMHPTEPTAQSLDQLITQIKEKNLQISTVSDLLKEDRLRNTPTTEQTKKK